MNQSFFNRVRTKLSLWLVASSLSMAGIVLTPALSTAEEIKIGTVDMQKALQSVEAGKTAKSQLEKEFNAKKTQVQNEESTLRKLGEEFKKQSLVLNEEARAKKQGELQEKAMKFEELKARSQMELQAKERELTEPIIVRIRSLIGELAKQKNYTVVLEKNENTVLYSLEKDDLTTDVVAAYNKKPKG